jgi:hypothetical protein
VNTTGESRKQCRLEEMRISDGKQVSVERPEQWQQIVGEQEVYPVAFGKSGGRWKQDGPARGRI